MIRQMCTNRAIVDSLECCMDDLIECFEDFIKKSLIIIFLGIGIIVGLLCYLLKVVSDRPSLNSATVVPESTGSVNNTRNEVIYNQRIKNVKEEVEMLNILKEKEEMKTDKIYKNITNRDIDKSKTTTAINTLNIPMCSSFDKNLLHTVGLSSCSKHGCCGGSTTHTCIPSRVPIPSLPASSSKNNLIPCVRKRSSKKSLPSLQICSKITKQGSCCSMCCYDEPKRNENLDRQRTYRNEH